MRAVPSAARTAGDSEAPEEALAEEVDEELLLEEELALESGEPAMGIAITGPVAGDTDIKTTFILKILSFCFC